MMKSLIFLYFSVVLAFAGCSQPDRKFQSDEMLTIQAMKDTVLKVEHEGRIHDISVVKVKVTNNFKSTLTIDIKEYGWLAMGSFSYIYRDSIEGTSFPNYNTHQERRINPNSYSYEYVLKIPKSIGVNFSINIYLDDNKKFIENKVIYWPSN